MKTLEDNSSARLIFVHVLMSREKEKEADRGKKISQVRFTFFTGKNGRVIRGVLRVPPLSTKVSFVRFDPEVTWQPRMGRRMFSKRLML